MRRRGGLFWGMILILLGAILLLENMGFLPVSAWGLFWPAVIILLGLWFLWGTTIGRRGVPTESASVPLGGAGKLNLTIHHGAGHLRLASGASSDQAVEGTFTGGLDKREDRSGEALHLDLSVPADQVLDVIPFGGPRGIDWDVKVTDSVPVELRVETGASETRLNLEALKVQRLSLRTGASETHVMFPAAAGLTTAELGLGAAAVKLQVPAGVAGRIQIKSGLSDIKIDTSRFPGSGGIYQSPDYETANNKVDMQIEAGVGSIEVR